MIKVYQDTENPNMPKGTHFYRGKPEQWFCYDHVLMKKPLMPRFDSDRFQVLFMDKLTMHTPNLADENYRKLSALFPNAVTETIDPATGEVVRAIDKDVLMHEINTRVVEGREERYQFTWPDKKKAVLAANAPISAALRPVRADSVGRDGTPGGWDSENLYI